MKTTINSKEIVLISDGGNYSVRVYNEEGSVLYSKTGMDKDDAKFVYDEQRKAIAETGELSTSFIY